MLRRGSHEYFERLQRTDLLIDRHSGAQAEDVGREAAEELLQNLAHGGCVDHHLQDQVRHRTNLWQRKNHHYQQNNVLM